ncbi:hypothetical protein EPI10_016288 [Gossypium australe]|uniref:Uncharacterized protein n=1 Tax=Gossypium australe TaxID=47621 RepID=A0A5B6VNJ5_9ROSI|nr:hypothetical protein EPI10_016288 [Gossypium australe]
MKLDEIQAMCFLRSFLVYHRIEKLSSVLSFILVLLWCLLRPIAWHLRTERVETAVARVVRSSIHSSECVSVGYTGVVCKEEGLDFEAVHRLSPAS